MTPKTEDLFRGGKGNTHGRGDRDCRQENYSVMKILIIRVENIG